MTLVQQNVANLTERNQEKVIERCGRICYNSISAIQEGSAEKFIKGIIKSGHTSVLEHSAITLAMTYDGYCKSTAKYLFEVPANEMHETRYLEIFSDVRNSNDTLYFIVSANCRAWLEWLRKQYTYLDGCLQSFADAVYNIALILKEVSPVIFAEFEVPKSYDFSDWLELTEFGLIDWFTNNDFPDNKLIDFWKKNCCIYAFELTTTRYTQNQLVRHRCAHFSVQSQRYCNYSTDKFGNHIKFIINAPTVKDKSILEEFAADAEMCYLQLVKQGAKPEDARLVLPNMTATVMAMSATKPEWDSIFALRGDNHAQQEVHDLCYMIKQELDEACN